MPAYYEQKLIISEVASRITTDELIQRRSSTHKLINIPQIHEEVEYGATSSDSVGAAHLLDYNNFFNSYLLPNKPCIIKNLCGEWRCRTEWVLPNGSPNFDFIKQTFGSAQVPVADCGDVKYDAHTKHDMTVAEYIKYWEKYRTDGYPPTSRCLYLKDWHFTRDFPDYQAYTTPIYFCSDWLNEFWDTKASSADDYRFVYMGPKGSWTPFHADVFRSHSWSANICGRKKWIFYAPGDEEKLRDKFGHMTFDVTSPEMSDKSKFPNFNSEESIEIVQEAGEVMFVPSCWHHQVYNLEDTISINHNWLNGCNVDLCWDHLKQSLRDVQKEITDCRAMDDWHQHCQVILKACNGIDYAEFIQFMQIIGHNRIQRLRTESGRQVLPNSLNASREITQCSMGSLQCEDIGTVSENTMQNDIENSMDHQHDVCLDLGDRITVRCNATKITQSKNNHETGKCELIPGGEERRGFSEQAAGDSQGVKQSNYRNHLLFDLQRIKYVIEDIMNTEEIKHIDLSKLNQNLGSFLRLVVLTIEEY